MREPRAWTAASARAESLLLRHRARQLLTDHVREERVTTELAHLPDAPSVAEEQEVGNSVHREAPRKLGVLVDVDLDEHDVRAREGPKHARQSRRKEVAIRAVRSPHVQD